MGGISLDAGAAAAAPADPAHPTSFREAIVIRAVRSLALLGSTAERDRLEAWRHHPHLLTRRQARRVLAEVDAQAH